MTNSFFVKSANKKNFNRIVIKIGSSLLIRQAEPSGVNKQWLEAVFTDLNQLISLGCEIIIVTSGATALGCQKQNWLKASLSLSQKQAAAAIGQVNLMQAYQEAKAAKLPKQISIAQVLLTPNDTEARRPHLNARDTIKQLLNENCLPIINENDSVATAELQYGDNDRLAARVADMVEADLLIILSDVDGLYDSPDLNTAGFIANVASITADIYKMAKGSKSKVGSGGMYSKIEAAEIATASGIPVIICNGRNNNPIQKLRGGAPHTYFVPKEIAINARKRWIRGTLSKTGTITVDDGAKKALLARKSLLPAGVIAVAGDFQRGDTIEILDVEKRRLGVGLISYDFGESNKIKGRNSLEIEEILGYSRGAALVHADNIALK